MDFTVHLDADLVQIVTYSDLVLRKKVAGRGG